jgi:hypothetical protein
MYRGEEQGVKSREVRAGFGFANSLISAPQPLASRLAQVKR